jgi:hypothetical protein
LSGKNIVMSWTRPGFVLQENSDIANVNGWTNVAGGGTNPFTLQVPATAGAKFYRLIKP